MGLIRRGVEALLFGMWLGLVVMFVVFVLLAVDALVNVFF